MCTQSQAILYSVVVKVESLYGWPCNVWSAGAQRECRANTRVTVPGNVKSFVGIGGTLFECGVRNA